MGVKIERGKQASRNEKILDSAKGTERKHTMKKNAGYVINYEDNTITLTKAFAKQAQNPATKEFRELAKLHKNFPDFTITKRTAKVNEDKERHAGLSIPWMTNYIKTYIKDEAAVAEFEEVKAFYRGMSGYYGKVKGWFLNKYPNYKEIDFAELAASKSAANQATATQTINQVVAAQPIANRE